MNTDPRILPGARVLVFDRTNYKDDKTTPLEVTMLPATVLRRYACKSKYFGRYSDLIAVKFDYGRISNGVFTSGIQLLDENQSLPDTVDDSGVSEVCNDLLSEPPNCDCRGDYDYDDSLPHREWCSSVRITKICV